MTWVGVPDIVAAWRSSVPHVSGMRFHSVFIHGSPKVDFTNSSHVSVRCELSDLLLVVDEITSAGAVLDRRAVLVQAKLFAAGGGFSIVGQARHQLDLLEHWHPFTFANSPPFHGAPRDFTLSGQPGNAGESGKYGGIGGVASAPVPFEWEHIDPSSTPAMSRSTGTDLATFLAGMATGASRVGREAIAGGHDDWSATIDELLAISAPSTVALTASLGPSRRHPRGVISLTLSSAELRSLVGPDAINADPALPGADRVERGRDDGISFVHLLFVSRRT